MGFFSGWMRARMYRKEIEKGVSKVIREAKSDDVVIDDDSDNAGREFGFSAILDVPLSKQDDVYKFLKEEYQEDKIIKEIKPRLLKIQQGTKLNGQLRFLTVELKKVESSLLFSFSGEYSRWAGPAWNFNLKKVEKGFNHMVKIINELFGKNSQNKTKNKFCSKCGEKVDFKDKFCPHCGENRIE